MKKYIKDLLLNNTKKEKNYVIIDAEVTGLDENVDEIIKLTAIKVENNIIVDKFFEYVKPIHSIPKYVSDITGITDDILKDADQIEEVIKRFEVFVGSYTLISHNLGFIISFLMNVDKEEDSPWKKNKQIDTLKLCREKLICGYKLIYLREIFNLPKEDSDEKLIYNIYNELIDFKLISRLNVYFKNTIDYCKKALEKESTNIKSLCNKRNEYNYMISMITEEDIKNIDDKTIMDVPLIEWLDCIKYYGNFNVLLEKFEERYNK